MRYFRKIVGEKVYLSPINIDDAEKYTEWVNDLEVTAALPVVHRVYSLQAEQEALERISKQDYHFAVVTTEEDELIGNCSVFGIDWIHRTGEFGIFIGNKDYWNRGYGSEAAVLTLDFAFNILNLNNVMLRVRSFNKRAIACYKKCGFKEIGRRREACILGGKKYDDIYMDILASEFVGRVNAISKIIEGYSQPGR